MNILFVCTGNTCRSIMAEIILKEKIRNRFGENALKIVGVESAGIMADDSTNISHNANKVLEEFYNKKFDSKRKSRLLDSKIIENCDIILSVTKGHKEFIQRNFSIKNNKLFTIEEFVNESCDISDPYMGDLEIYRSTLFKLDYLLNKVLDKLNEFGGRNGKHF